MTDKDIFITLHILPTNFQLNFQVQNFSQVIKLLKKNPTKPASPKKKQAKNTPHKKIKWMHSTV